jgi:SAM-dependent methyltransferase
MNNTLRFYKNKLPFKERQFNRIFPLASYFGEMIGDKTEVNIADLGAGMFSTTGSTYPTAIVHLYPSDILAEEYLKLLKKAKVIPILSVERQDMVQLTYKDNFFDVVHCINALDHCEDPLKALQEMYRVCKVGGWIYLKHYYNVAEYEKYAGNHQWNICKAEDFDDCIVWNKTEKFLLSDYFTGFNTIVQPVAVPPGLEITSKLRKKE